MKKIRIIGIETDEGVTHFQTDALADDISDSVFYANEKLYEDGENEMFFNNIERHLFANTKTTMFQAIQLEIY